jgi:hypothetical protein
MASREQKFITKHLGIPLEKGFETLEDSSIVVKGFFTSDNVDEIGDIITKEATINAIPKYREWGNIRYMHMPKPVAKVLNIGKDDGLKWNEVEINVIDPEAIFQVKNGLLKALSVGIIIKSFDDIDIDEETWGWTINAYDLAEISLVDHPANYDARLFLDEDKNIPVNTELRQLVAANGFAVVSKALGAVTTLGEGINMAQLERNLQAGMEELAKPVEEETEEEGVELSLEEEADPSDEAVDHEDLEQLAELDLAGTVEEDEPAPWAEDEAEAESEDVEEELVMEESGVEFTETTDEEDELLEILTDSLEAEEDEEADIEAEEAIEDVDDEDEAILNDDFVLSVAQAIVDLLSEAEAEAPAVEETEEQPEAEKVEAEDDATEEETDELTALTEQVADLQSKIAELSKPAKRAGLVKSTVLPHEAIETIEEAEEEEAPDLLRDALKSYINRPDTVVIRDRS